MNSDVEQYIEWYQRMLTIRLFEEMAFKLYTMGKLPGVMHYAIGQEGVSVGAAMALRKDDFITSTHRGHGDVIAKGAQPDRMFAELMAKETGYCHGKGGSLHIMDFENGVLGANGIVGAGVPIATGAALSIMMRGTDQVVVCFIGDGAIANSAFHEGFHMAALWKLPLIVVRHNNQYAESTPRDVYQGMPNVAKWVSGYGVDVADIDGNDVRLVYETVKKFVDRARKGEGPFFVDCLTYRWMGHNVGDPMAYRPKGELEKWKEMDPIKRFEDFLINNINLPVKTVKGIKKEVSEKIEAAVRFAEESPDVKAEDALSGIYA
jgi:TPP-dependent pyruvate/acetoin dehydrogenase alpha subunit